MRCEPARLILELDLARMGEADWRDLDAVEDHLSACKECQLWHHRRFIEENRLAKAMRDIPVPPPKHSMVKGQTSLFTWKSRQNSLICASLLLLLAALSLDIYLSTKPKVLDIESAAWLMREGFEPDFDYESLVGDARVKGVMFTGSTEVARLLQRNVAGRLDAAGRPIPLIAETGGQNAMIVDSTALPEQVARDAVASAFDSAGQRCSSLRVLFLQEDVAEKMLDQILGAMDELKIGDPFDLTTDIGPVIDDEARARLIAHTERMTKEAKLLKACVLDPALSGGTFFAPRVFAIEDMNQLKREVFGPILHVVRYAGNRLDAVCDAINPVILGLDLVYPLLLLVLPLPFPCLLLFIKNP